MKIGVMVESFRRGFRGGVEKAAALGAQGIQVYATRGDMAPENLVGARRKEFLDLLAVAQSLPGILAVNISVAVGDKLRGLKGSVCAAAGTIAPSFMIILLIAIFLTPDMITNNPILSSIFKGIRPVVVALIVAPVISSARSAGIGLRTAWIPAAVALLIWSKLPYISNPILYIVLGGAAGWYILSRSVRRQQSAKEDGQQ